jgi:hypothetical protein
MTMQLSGGGRFGRLPRRRQIASRGNGGAARVGLGLVSHDAIVISGLLRAGHTGRGRRHNRSCCCRLG